jgi:hypothetical protein
MARYAFAFQVTQRRIQIAGYLLASFMCNVGRDSSVGIATR